MDLTKMNTDTVPAMLTPREAVLEPKRCGVGWARQHREAERGGESVGAEGCGFGCGRNDECEGENYEIKTEAIKAAESGVRMCRRFRS